MFLAGEDIAQIRVRLFSGNILLTHPGLTDLRLCRWEIPPSMARIVDACDGYE